MVERDCCRGGDGEEGWVVGVADKGGEVERETRDGGASRAVFDFMAEYCDGCCCDGDCVGVCEAVVIDLELSRAVSIRYFERLIIYSLLSFTLTCNLSSVGIASKKLLSIKSNDAIVY